MLSSRQSLGDSPWQRLRLLQYLFPKVTLHIKMQPANPGKEREDHPGNTNGHSLRVASTTSAHIPTANTWDSTSLLEKWWEMQALVSCFIATTVNYMDMERNCWTPGMSAAQCHPECKEMDCLVPAHLVEHQKPAIQTLSFPELPTQGGIPGSAQVVSLDLVETSIFLFLNVSAWLSWNTSRFYKILGVSYMNTILHKN